MSTNEQGTIQNLFSELGKKIDHLIEEGKKKKEGLTGEIEEKIEELKGRKEKLEEEFDGFVKRNEPRWTEAQNHLENAIGEIKQAADAVFTKMKPEKEEKVDGQ